MESVRIAGPDDLQPYCEQLKQAGTVALALEAEGPDPLCHKLCRLHVATDEMPLLSLERSAFSPNGASILGELFNPDAVRIFHNAKSALQFLMPLGLRPKLLFDALLAAQLLEVSAEYSADVQGLARYFLDEGSSDRPGVYSAAGPTGEQPLRQSARDARLLLRLRQAMIPRLKENGLSRVAGIEFQCAKAVAHMEYKGIHLDMAKWLRLTEKNVQERDEALSAIAGFQGAPAAQATLWGGVEFPGLNPDSSPAVIKLLNSHGIEVAATSKRDLLPYREHPLVRKLLQYRKAAKALSAFLLPLPERLHPATGRLHPRYEQLMVSSGRMSCSRPNIQQIPRERSFRECVAPPAGRSLIVADYSQIELRVAAQIAGDARMLAAYQAGDDLHLLTASHIANKPMELVSKQERQAYKAVNLGLIYGMGAAGLMETARQSYGVDMSLEEATLFRRRFFETYSGIAAWHDGLKRQPRHEAATLTGRRIAFREAAGLPERSNLPVQGTAADILKKALGLLVDRLDGPGGQGGQGERDGQTWIVAAVHDEILLECDTSRVNEAAAVLKASMEEAANGILPDVPTVVEPVISASWAEK